MDVGEKAKLDIEKRNEDSVSYHTTGLPCGIADFANSAMGMVTDDNFLSSMVDSYVAPVWEHPADSQHLGFSVPAGLQEPDSLLKGSLLSQLPTDAAFVDRAAKLSSFSSGNIADFMNSFAMDQTGSPYNQHTPMLHGPHPVFMDTAIFQVSGGEPQKNEIVPQMKNTRHINEAKQEKSGESDSGGYGQEEPSLMDTGTKPCLSKKRKRQGQDTKLGQSQQLSGGDATINNSPHKQSSKAIDTPKKDYIHVRARRGQATNSHSLAERVRREKIRDRMKFLQDLVPGCSKVTGKAVMLDEIINYVQSLQRQVEFLSMKLATVDPRMGFKIDGLLAKDQIFATRAGPSSLGLSPDMPMAYPLMNPSQPSLPAIGSSSDILRNLDSQIRNINQGYKDPTQQMPNVWNDELQNVVQMGFSPNAPLENQETPQNSSLSSGHMKVEV